MTNWNTITDAQAEALIKALDLVAIRHSVADCDIWYKKAEAENCKSYFDITPFLRRSLYPDCSFELNRQAAVNDVITSLIRDGLWKPYDKS